MVRALTAAMMVFTYAESAKSTPPATESECVRLSGSQIGQLPLIVEVAGQKVEFIEWKATDITADELIGFTVQASDALRFTVEAGDSTFSGSANWIHPSGVVGPQVKPIRALTVCPL
jgi:hypothetical protein